MAKTHRSKNPEAPQNLDSAGSPNIQLLSISLQTTLQLFHLEAPKNPFVSEENRQTEIVSLISDQWLHRDQLFDNSRTRCSKAEHEIVTASPLFQSVSEYSSNRSVIS
jgi:hypothetical protein